ncbi:MAG: hypothetical protein DRN96_01180 [Thermoproteota archaeon]|nr:MAG: hypothetical protein DRN96_01180 [Candidatus Korarchaeota archaeon]RLG54673.1 MAG: hypothetical protein DRN99_04690 [Candidatus Korarchaeota archaeon]
MTGEVPLTPVGREDIHKLEAALLVNTLFRPEVLEAIRSPEERLTWIDALAVAAGALAREKARMSIREIAEDLGRTEATIRAHLTGKTKAGQLVKKTYEEMLRKGGEISYISLLGLPEIRELVLALEEVHGVLKKAMDALSNLLKELERLTDIGGALKSLSDLISELRNLTEATQRLLVRLGGEKQGS